MISRRGERSAAAVTDSGAAHATAGGVAVSGVVHGDVSVQSPPVARSGYRQQVLRIAPPTLLGRETELAELAAFCTEPDRSSYVWWRAPAWSGKTALMSWFALHPPKSVEIVPFFVTARFAGQSDRTAFVEVVGEQLAALLGRAIPPLLSEATRDGHLLALLDEAAGHCARRGKRLVLLVDGLDEDRGVTTGPDAYSVAALLPRRPPAGLRVIVAGRPDPPVPRDVPDDHPLHDVGIVRVLGGSPYAAAVRADCERELARLLNGTPEERDLLGLMTAAGGGLRSSDLAELTGCSEWDVTQRLRAVTGRTFAARAGLGQSTARPTADVSEVYVLGHEELQSKALIMLGRERLREYRERLHSWAAEYHRRGWPAGTPEYLLRGYATLLRATADLPRAVACASDSTRHDRMREVTGGDAAALAEIDTAAALVLASEETDVVSAAVLAAHRQRLVQRNAFPTDLPALWAAVGQPDRAEALACGLDTPDEVALALAEIAKAVGSAGDRERAARLADVIEGLRGGVDTAFWRARRRAAVAEAAGAAGDYARAAAQEQGVDDLVTAARREGDESAVLAARATAAAASGNEGRARELAATVEEVARAGSDEWRTVDLVWPLETLSRERMVVVLRHLSVLARTVRSSRHRTEIEATLAAAAADGNVTQHLPALHHAIAQVRQWSLPPMWALEAAGPLAEAAAAAQDVRRATQLTDYIAEAASLPAHPCWADSSSRRSLARAAVRALEGCADPSRASHLSLALEALAGSSAAPGAVMPASNAGEGRDEENALSDRDEFEKGDHECLLTAAAGAAALARDVPRAEALVRAITDAEERAEAVTLVARVLLRHGDPDRAATLAVAAERLCRDSTASGLRVWELAALARVTAATGDLTSAARAADALGDLVVAAAAPHRRAEAQVALVKALAAMGELVRATAVSRSVQMPVYKQWALQEVLRALCDVGADAQAEELVRGISNQRDRAEAGHLLVHEAITRGQFGRAHRLSDGFRELPELEAEWSASLTRSAALGGARHRASVLADSLCDLARAPWGHRRRSTLQRYAAEAVAWSRRYEQAEVLARGIVGEYSKAEALAALVQAAAELGEAGLAAVWAHRAERFVESVVQSGYRASGMSRLAEAIVATGDVGTALDLAERIPLRRSRAATLAKLTRSVEPEHGRRLMARALTMGDWSHMLDDLVPLAAAAPQALIDVLLGEQAGSSAQQVCMGR